LLSESRVTDVAQNLIYGTNATGLSIDALYRHKRLHLIPSLTTPIADTELDSLSLYGHLERALHDTARVAERANSMGSPTLALKSAQVRTAIIREFFERLPEGEGLDLIATAREADSFVRAVIGLVKQTPELGFRVAAQLEEDGTAPDLAAAFRANAKALQAARPQNQEVTQ
jgi:hypothetical protein